MATQETETPFWQDVITVLSVFIIALSLGVLVSVKKLEAATPTHRVEISQTLQVKPLVELLKIEESAIKESAMLKAGEGVEHTFIRQLVEGGSSLKTAQKRAHQVAILAGFVGPGQEVRVKDGQQKVAYVLDQEQGQIITYLNGDEVQRTQIADNYQQIKQLNPTPFEYIHIS